MKILFKRNKEIPLETVRQGECFALCKDDDDVYMAVFGDVFGEIAGIACANLRSGEITVHSGKMGVYPLSSTLMANFALQKGEEVGNERYCPIES